MDGLLVTLGCSWVYGVGAHYKEGMTREEYELHGRDEEQVKPYAFRTLLAERNNLEPVNFSLGGSSNQRNFRLATEFFSSQEFEEYQNKYSTIIVLWGITSTARNEVYDASIKEWRKLLYNKNTPKTEEHHDRNLLRDILVAKFYDHDEEVRILSNHMRHWNQCFNCMGVKNLWFDTLNHHKYNYEFNNICLDHPRDLLSQITSHKENDRFHGSVHTIDCDRVKKGIKQKILNPYTKHPTKKGHEKIFDLLDPYVKNLLPRL